MSKSIEQIATERLGEIVEVRKALAAAEAKAKAAERERDEWRKRAEDATAEAQGANEAMQKADYWTGVRTEERDAACAYAARLETRVKELEAAFEERDPVNLLARAEATEAERDELKARYLDLRAKIDKASEVIDGWEKYANQCPDATVARTVWDCIGEISDALEDAPAALRAALEQAADTKEPTP